MTCSRRTFLSVAALSALAGCATADRTAVAPQSAFVQGSGGVLLHYLDFGGRGTPVILLAGAGNSAWVYEDFGRELARDYRVLALTRRGHGESGYPATGYSQDTLAEDLRLFMEQRGLTRTALVGHSIAGAELTNFAGKYPERVTALVYLDAAYDRSTQGVVDMADPVTPTAASADDRASVESFISYVHRTRPDLVRYWTRAVQRDLQASIAIRPEGGAGWKTSNAIFGELIGGVSSAPPEYSKVTAPALAIYSIEDSSYRLPANASREQQEALTAFTNGPEATWRGASIEQFRNGPNRLVVEMDAGHHMFLHRPEETGTLVRSFLARHSRR